MTIFESIKVELNHLLSNSKVKKIFRRKLKKNLIENYKNPMLSITDIQKTGKLYNGYSLVQKILTKKFLLWILNSCLGLE